MTADSKLAELLAAKKAVQEEKMLDTNPVLASDLDGVLEYNDPAELTKAEVKAESKVAKSALTAYVPVRLQQIIRKDGTVFKPSNGLFIPITEEETSLCKYYESVGRLRKDAE